MKVLTVAVITQTIDPYLLNILNTSRKYKVACVDSGIDCSVSVDIILTDMIDAIPVLVEHGRVIFYEKAVSGKQLCQALSLGCVGYIVLNSPKELIEWAFLIVSEGGNYVDPRISAGIINQGVRLTAQPSEILTNRENEVVKHISMGMSNKQISQKLFISEKTVKNHVTNILKKLNLKDRTKLAIYALTKEPQTQNYEVYN